MIQEQKFKILFRIVYSLIGSYLTTLSYIVFRIDSKLTNPYLVFLISFLIFFFISSVFGIYINKIKKLIKNNAYLSIKLNSIVIVMVILLLFLYTINSLNKIKNYDIISDFDTIQKKEYELINLNKIVVGILLVIVFSIFLFFDFKKINLNENLTTNEYLKLFLLLLFLLGILIPLSILLDNFIRIIGFAIGLAGGL